MTNIRRYETTGRPVFITAVCHHRMPCIQSDWQKELLLAIMREVKSAFGFSMHAYVILDDHFHWMITPDNSGLSKVMQSIKLRYAHRYKKKIENVENVMLWQRRFWDHIIRDEDDLHRHMDYIHYNPVRHGYVSKPVKYRWSSLKTHIQLGNYEPEWGVSTTPQRILSMDFE